MESNLHYIHHIEKLESARKFSMDLRNVAQVAPSKWQWNIRRDVVQYEAHNNDRCFPQNCEWMLSNGHDFSSLFVHWRVTKEKKKKMLFDVLLERWYHFFWPAAFFCTFSVGQALGLSSALDHCHPFLSGDGPKN